MEPMKRLYLNVYTAEQWQDVLLVHREISKRTGRDSFSATGIELFTDRAARLRDKKMGRDEVGKLQSEIAGLRSDIEDLKEGMAQLLDLLTCDNYPMFTRDEIEERIKER